jgi:CHASE2 domain-containing sensor protein
MSEQSSAQMTGNSGVERWALAAFVTAFVAALVWSDVLWDWDQVVYDHYLASAHTAAPTDVVIVAIDEQSLAAIHAASGARWPWPRALHAELLLRLHDAGASAMLLDVLFTESDRANPDNDAALAIALQTAGKVVLTVHLAKLSGGDGQRHSLVVPIAAVANAAAGLGPTHTRFDRDGILREISLALASGDQRIPHASLSLRMLLDPQAMNDVPGACRPQHRR